MDFIQVDYWYMLAEYSVASVAAESKYGLELAREWIKKIIGAGPTQNLLSGNYVTFKCILPYSPGKV